MDCEAIYVCVKDMWGWCILYHTTQDVMYFMSCCLSYSCFNSHSFVSKVDCEYIMVFIECINAMDLYIDR